MEDNKHPIMGVYDYSPTVATDKSEFVLYCTGLCGTIRKYSEYEKEERSVHEHPVTS